MSINVFLTDKLPKEKDKIISIISFIDKVEYRDNVLSTGLCTYGRKNVYEVWETSDVVSHKEYNDIYISKNKNYLFGLVIIDNIGSYEELKLYIKKKYSDFYKISDENKMNIVKIWHYIPQLLKIYNDKKTNYSLLCEAREIAYKNYYKDFRYPAATVIGIEGNKILIYFLATRCETYKAIENSRQVSSYNYPQNIFLEKPMFSRAVSFKTACDYVEKIIISGTASIRGYESMHTENLIKQLDESLRNYKTFFEIENNISNTCRVYLSKIQKSNYKIIISKLEENFGSDKYVLLQGDICRKELLIEIEGILNA